MFFLLPMFCAYFLVDASVAVQSRCDQVAPIYASGQWRRTPERTQAVVLIHGFHLQILFQKNPKLEYRLWQRPESPLVKELGKKADVFAFAYTQNADLSTVLKDCKLAEIVAQIRQLGYTEIILMGHSAGGLLAREFVEDHPDAGITRVVQVCAPNTGTPFAHLKGPRSQQAFIQCLSEEGRHRSLKVRADKQIPSSVQFVCVVGRHGMTASDGVVPCVSQWSDDLRKQGIPGITLLGGHREILFEARTVHALSNLICTPQPRWDAERVEQARKLMFGK